MAKRSDSRLGKQVKQAVRNTGWTTYRLAKLSGVAVQVIDRFMANERDMTLRTASKLCDVLRLELRSTDR